MWEDHIFHDLTRANWFPCTEEVGKLLFLREESKNNPTDAKSEAGGEGLGNRKSQV